MIAIDALGGDFAPSVVLDAALLCAEQGVPLLLCGPQKILEEELDRKNSSWRSLPLSLEDAPDIILMDDEPVLSVKKKPASSLVKTIEMVAQGKATAALSAGNSGAFVVAATFILGREEGVDRPSLAGFLPTNQGFTLVVDLGANTEVRAPHLVQFARLGARYMQQVAGLPSPRVGILANGHEERKGSALTKEAYALLSQEKELNFVGNLEPYHLYQHLADVLVTDGFSGNILLKTMEAVFELTKKTITDSFNQLEYSNRKEKSFVLEKFSRAIDQTSTILDHRTFGGALILGVRGRAVVCHGAADKISIKNAILMLHKKSISEQLQSRKKE